MLGHLQVLNYAKNYLPETSLPSEFFWLKTCQRLVIISFNQNVILHQLKMAPTAEHFKGPQAYQFLLETISGLRSQVLAENEIVHQFKQSLINYNNVPKKCHQTVKLLEKLFMDSKKIRGQFLHGIGQKTYAALARKLALKYAQNPGQEVLITGTGQLAVDIIGQLIKKCPLTITGRNSDRMNFLANDYGLKTKSWDLKHQLIQFPTIINTIGAPTQIFDENFFESWYRLHQGPKVFVVLVAPSVISTGLGAKDGVFRLNDIFQMGVIKNQEKLSKVEQAKKAIEELAHKRQGSMLQSYPFGWEEIKFA